MKKLLSLCLAVVMMVCLLAGVTVNAADNEYYTLRRENFGIEFNQSSSLGWTTQIISSGMIGAGAFAMNPSDSSLVNDRMNGTVAVGKAANVAITAQIYIDTPGTYTAFMLVEQSGNGLKFAIDGQETTTAFGATANSTSGGATAYAMEKADRTWTLGAGWHTVTVTTTVAAGKFHTVFITDDTGLESSNITYKQGNTNATVDSKVNMAAYEDFTVPSAGTLVATPDENTENEQMTFVTLTWSGEADASGIAKYEIHNGTEYVDVTNEESYIVDNLLSASNYTFKLKVTDYFGYTAETTATARTNGTPDEEGPQWPADAAITFENASFGSTITWPEATDNREVAGYEIYEDAVDASNLIASVDAETLSYTISLIPGESKDIVVVAKDLGGNLSEEELTATVASTVGSGGGYTLRLENFDMPNPDLRIWDGQNISEAMISAGCIVFNEYPSTPRERGRVMVSKAAGAEVSAEIWVDTPGEYALFAQIESGSQINAILNGQKTLGYLSPDALTTDAGAKAYHWIKANRTWTLNEGWNTLTLSADAADQRIAALFLTDGVTIEASELTYLTDNATAVLDGKLNTAMYEDTEGPAFDSEIDLTYEDGAITIAWDEAEDQTFVPANAAEGSEYESLASGLQAYRIYVNNKVVGEVAYDEERTFEINETNLGKALKGGEWLNIMVEALDVYGNETPITLDYKVSKYVVTGDAITVSVGTDVVASADITNVSEDDVNFRLSIAIYDENGEIVAGDVTYDTIVPGDGDTYTATITGAPDTTTYTVKAHLWDVDDLTSIVATKTIAPVPAEAE